MVKEFEDIYFGKKTLPILNSSFRRYVDFLLAEKESVAFYRDLEFWKSKIERIPEAPCLPTVEQAYDSNRFKQLSYIKAEMHQKNCSAVTNLILEIKACEYIVMKHCH